MKTSQRIRRDLITKGVKFNANDNISFYLDDQDKNDLIEEVREIVVDLLNALVIDHRNDPNSIDTPTRVAKMLINELFSGRYNHTPELTLFPNTRKNDELITVGPIRVQSTCSHHLVTVSGDAWIGVIANEHLLGLSKYSRLTKWIMSRPQIQEESVVQLGTLIEQIISPSFIGIVIRAEHQCMSCRGVEERDASMTTSYFGGKYGDDRQKREEFFELINSQGFTRC